MVEGHWNHAGGGFEYNVSCCGVAGLSYYGNFIGVIYVAPGLRLERFLHGVHHMFRENIQIAALQQFIFINQKKLITKVNWHELRYFHIQNVKSPQ